MNTRDTLKINANNHLEIGGADTVLLAKKYGTPLYVMDESYIRQMCRAFSSTIKSEYGNGLVVFASKAFSCIGIYKIIDDEQLGADVVSGGEIYTALKAGFDPSKMFFHGNNKLPYEIKYAIENKVGYIVVDSLDEIKLIDKIAAENNILQKILFRLNPGVEAHTHHAVQTARIDSKFGFSISNGEADEALTLALSCQNICPMGFHCHIGSQIFDKNAFVIAVDKMTDYMAYVKDNFKFEAEVLNLGGGYGIYYTEGDPYFSPNEYADYVTKFLNELKLCLSEKKLKKPFLVIEPGRSIVGEAGITLYTVGSIKNIKNIKKYVGIDGGMGDNPRYALYQAKYSAILANRAADDANETVTIAGKCCESGDLIAVDIKLPKAETGDIVAVFSTGAYNYSMSSNYNRNPIPPVVLVNNGKSAYLVKPQTYEDITRLDVVPEWIKK